jgi:hypothetical protein
MIDRPPTPTWKEGVIVAVLFLVLLAVLVLALEGAVSFIDPGNCVTFDSATGDCTKKMTTEELIEAYQQNN